jgi:hypothetical protein
MTNSAQAKESPSAQRLSPPPAVLSRPCGGARGPRRRDHYQSAWRNERQACSCADDAMPGAAGPRALLRRPRIRPAHARRRSSDRHPLDLVRNARCEPPGQPLQELMPHGFLLSIGRGRRSPASTVHEGDPSTTVTPPYRRKVGVVASASRRRPARQTRLRHRRRSEGPVRRLESHAAIEGRRSQPQKKARRRSGGPVRRPESHAAIEGRRSQPQ